MQELQDYIRLCCSIFAIAEGRPKTRHLSSYAFHFWWNCYTLKTLLFFKKKMLLHISERAVFPKFVSIIIFNFM